MRKMISSAVPPSMIAANASTVASRPMSERIAGWRRSGSGCAYAGQRKTVPSDLDLLARVAIASVLGAALGLERERRGQVAGMRTHGLVACGAAVFTLAGAYGFADVHRGPNVDPMRVAAQVASGIGFIGGGAILREGATIRGLTTAASLWAAGALGVAAGAGLWRTATIGLAVALVMLVGLRVVRERFGHRY